MKIAVILLILALNLPSSLLASPPSETEYSSIIGSNSTRIIAPGETLMELAVRSSIGFQTLQNANPEVDPWLPDEGTQVIIPGRAIFPDQLAPGLTINLAEMRIFYLPASIKSQEPAFFPLGIGREGWDTPEGQFSVILKKEAPLWRVPQSIREENPDLPDFVPSGPNNPLGEYWLGLSAPGYGLHGTNRPFGVGRRISHGCIRLYDQDIETLFHSVDPGTPVRIVYQPIKVASFGRELFLEVHPDFLNRLQDPFQEALTSVSRTGWSGNVDYEKILSVISEQRGIPAIIGTE